MFSKDANLSKELKISNFFETFFVGASFNRTFGVSV
jgi:hypothetical protein